MTTLATLKTWTAALLAAVITLHHSAQAAEYPADRPITVIVPFAAGGPTDRVARDLALAMSKSLGTRVIVDNRSGAGGTIGAKLVAQAKSDGYTLLVHNIAMATAPALYKKLGYDPLRDFEPLGEIVDVPMMLVANKSFPGQTLNEFAHNLKAAKPSAVFGHAGAGSASHLCGLLFVKAFKLDVLMTPYRGSAPALMDLVAGTTQIGCDQTTNVAGHLKGSSIRAVATMQDQRVDAFKDVATAKEQGAAGLSIRVWHGIYAPKGTPKPVMDKLTSALQAAVRDADFKNGMVQVGAEVVAPERATPAGLRGQLEDQIKQWDAVIRAAGVSAE